MTIFGIILAAAVIGAAIWTIDFYTAAPPHFFGGLVYDVVVYIGLALLLVVLGLWAAQVISAWWLLYLLIGIVVALIGAFLWAIIFPVLLGLQAVVAKIAQLVP